jgi:hypothetical protein
LIRHLIRYPGGKKLSWGAFIQVMHKDPENIILLREACRLLEMPDNSTERFVFYDLLEEIIFSKMNWKSESKSIYTRLLQGKSCRASTTS